MYLKIILLHSEAENLFIIQEEKVITLKDITSISSSPSHNSIFKWDEKKEFLCQLDDAVEIFLLTIQKEYSMFIALHPLKAVAAGKKVVMIPLILYTDDTSGNRSKQI